MTSPLWDAGHRQATGCLHHTRQPQITVSPTMLPWPLSSLLQITQCPLGCMHTSPPSVKATQELPSLPTLGVFTLAPTMPGGKVGTT